MNIEPLELNGKLLLFFKGVSIPRDILGFFQPFRIYDACIAKNIETSVICMIFKDNRFKKAREFQIFQKEYTSKRFFYFFPLNYSKNHKDCIYEFCLWLSVENNEKSIGRRYLETLRVISLSAWLSCLVFPPPSYH